MRPSLALPPPPPGPSGFLLPARIGLLLISVWVVVMVYRAPPDPAVRVLDEGWQLRTLADDGTVQPLPGTLPAVWSTALGGPERAFATIDIQGSAEPQALWVEKPRYALEVTVDGLPVGRSGDPGGVARSARPVFLVLPVSEPGQTHELGLEIAGGYGEAGVFGRIAVGPVAAMHAMASSARIGPLATSLALALLAVLPLSVASRGPWRPAYTLYGLLVAAAAVVVWAYSYHPAVLGMPLGWQLALQRATLFWTVGLTGAYIATYVHGRPTRSTRRLLALSGVLGLLAALAPGAFAWWARTAAHAFTVGVIGTSMWWVVGAVRRRTAGHALLLAALSVLLVAFVLEVATVYGVRPMPSGTYLWVLVIMVILGAALVLRDADASARHERLLERFPDPLLTVDAAGYIVDANPSARVALGIDPGQDGAPLVFGWVESEHHPRMRGHLRRGLHRTDHIELMTLDGRWYESAATPVAHDQVLLDLRDITARRDMDRGLLQAARAETAGVLLGGLAHDFNNMLGTLLAHVGILKLRTTSDEVNDRLVKMEGSIERAASLTKRLLTVARGTNTTLATCDVRATCVGAIELVEPTLGPGVELTLQAPEETPPVYGDRDDLEQVLVNLLVNARDAIGARGRIRLAVTPFRLGEGERGVAVMVEDDGPGVPEGIRQELFEPFVTTKGHGTGLGLAVARQILADHHGRLWHEPTPDGGARFLLALRHADAVSEAPAPLPQHKQLLVVDDEEVLLEAWTAALQDAGYDVIATPDPIEAIEQIRTRPPDLLVTDLAMSPLSGLEVARALQSRAPQVPVLVVSAFVAPDLQTELSRRGWEFLTKPVRAARLVATVGHLRRQAERKHAGEADITSVMHVFPPLDELSADRLGFPSPADGPQPEGHLQ